MRLNLLVPEIVLFFATCIYLLLAFIVGRPAVLGLEDALRRVSFICCYYALSLFVVFLCARLKSIQECRQSKTQLAFNDFSRQALRTSFSYSRILCDLRLLLVNACTFTVYVNLKDLIPLINPNVYDQYIIDLEAFVFGFPLTAALGSTLTADSASYWSTVYTFFYSYMGLSVLIVLLHGKQQITHEFVTAFVLVWFIGILVVYALPTLGPCFYDWPAEHLIYPSGVHDMQEKLYRWMILLGENPFRQNAAYMISGLPSLHIAVPTLATYYLLRVNRIVGAASILFMMLTFYAALVFEWHYVSDLLAGICLGLFCIMLARKLTKTELKV